MGQSGHFDQFSFFQGYDTVREKWQYVVNDIALIFLPRPAQLNSGVQLVCLPHSPAEYRSVIVMGNILWPFYPFKMLFLWVGELTHLHHITPFCEHCQTNETLLREVLLNINLREGAQKKRFYLGLCPKLWVGGSPKSQTF